jgi:hypothetical protein
MNQNDDRQPPVVVSGGAAIPKGFLDQFMAALRAQEFTLPILEVRMSDDSRRRPRGVSGCEL